VPNCKFFLVTEAERRRARFQQHRDLSCHQVFFFLQGKTPREIHVILIETLREHAPLYATVKNWVVRFKRGDFSTYVAPRSGRSKTLNTPESFDQIHELIWENRRISAKSIAEQLAISHERVGTMIHEDLNMRNLSEKWVPKYLNADQKRQ
jgi:predicted HTH transcriptional regulator